jgi:hypothetical protein
MTDKAISPLRRRLIEDMAIRRLGPKTQHHYIRHVESFADFLRQFADKATAEDVHRYQLWLASIGTTVPTVNVSATALRFFFKVTLKRRDLADAVVSAMPRTARIAVAAGWRCTSIANMARFTAPIPSWDRRCSATRARPSLSLSHDGDDDNDQAVGNTPM